MKKLLFTVFGVLLTLPTHAQDFTYEYEGHTLNYTVSDAKPNTCTVAQNEPNSISGTLTIPETVKYGNTEYTVTGIVRDAFRECKTLTSVTIPNSVISIGDAAFYYCTALKSVTMGDSVTTIGGLAFYRTAIESVIIPNSVTTLGGSAFADCDDLSSVTIGNSLTTIESHVFHGCSALKSIDIPNSVTSIQKGAFGACDALESVTLPEGLSSLSDETFWLCKALSSITIPEGVKSLGKSCFADCNITEIVLPESLKTIGDECFHSCPLSAVRFGTNIERIGSEAFSTLSQFECSDKLVYLGDRAFGDNLRLLKINSDTPPQLASVSMGYTDDEAYNILVIVPANGDDNYKNDKTWQGFHIVETAPMKTVYMTGKYPLSEEIATTTQQMPGNVTSLAIVGPLADDDWNIIKRNLISCYQLDLSGVTNTEIPAEVFAKNQHILSLTLPDKLKTIGRKAFYKCRNLTIDHIPETTETIDDFAFAGCAAFDVTGMPASLKKIGSWAFYGCTRLQISKLPPVESIGREAFAKCSRLMELDLSASPITEIAEGTFRKCVKLRNVILPEKLTAIHGGYDNYFDGKFDLDGNITEEGSNGAFANTSVNFISFPETLTEIGEYAFFNTSLIGLELPDRIESISNATFADCSKIKSVSLPRTMTSVGDEAFNNCRGIKSISVPCAVPPSVGENAFDNVRYRNCMVAIPTMTYREYLNAPGWGAFTQLSNSIFLTYEEVDENGNPIPDSEDYQDDVEVGAVENGAYDEIVENIVSEEEQAAQDAALDEAMYGDEPTTPAEVAARVRNARKAARAQAQNTAHDKARKAFSRLYPGLSMTIGDNSGYRVRIEPKDGVEIVKIEFGGKDITDTYIDGMVTLPALYSKSDLKVYRKGSYNGIDHINTAARTATADVYNLQGIVVLKDASEAQVRQLAPGFYIYKGRKIAIK